MTAATSHSLPVCGRCGKENDVSNRYCSSCGAPLLNEPAEIATQIREIIKSELKDQKLLEIETAAAVAGRVSNWAKLFVFFAAVPLTLFLASLAIWGISKFGDVNRRLNEVGARAKSLETTSAELDKRYQALQQNAARYEALESELDTVKSDVSQIGKRIGFTPSSVISPGQKEQLQESLAEFDAYLQSVGYHPGRERLQVDIVDSFSDPDVSSRYDYVGRKLSLRKDYVMERPAHILEAYMTHILQIRKGGAGAYEETWVALITYFPGSFLGKSVGGETAVWPATLRADDDAPTTALLQTFWAIRALKGAKTFDAALWRTWLLSQDRYRSSDFEAGFFRELSGQLGDTARTDLYGILAAHGLRSD